MRRLLTNKDLTHFYTNSDCTVKISEENKDLFYYFYRREHNFSSKLESYHLQHFPLSTDIQKRSYLLRDFLEEIESSRKDGFDVHFEFCSYYGLNPFNNYYSIDGPKLFFTLEVKKLKIDSKRGIHCYIETGIYKEVKSDCTGEYNYVQIFPRVLKEMRTMTTKTTTQEPPPLLSMMNILKDKVLSAKVESYKRNRIRFSLSKRKFNFADHSM